MNAWNIAFVAFGVICTPLIAKLQSNKLIKTFQGFRLHGSNLSTTVVGSNLECVHLCLSHPRCASINYRKRETTVSHVCELNSKTKISNPGKFVSDKLCNYYEPILPIGGYTNPGKSCLDIREQTKGISLSNGEYWIKLDSEPLKVYCDMEEDGGGWTLISSLVLQQSEGLEWSWTNDYRQISEYSNNLGLSTDALRSLGERMPFKQLRFFCHKKIPGRTFDIATKLNNLGHHVVQFFTAQTNTFPDSCDSYYPLSDDNSIMAKECANWGYLHGKFSVGKWHYDGVILSSHRLFDHMAFVVTKAHWIVAQSSNGRWECDDFYENMGYSKSTGDFWKIFVR